ncbi:MAG: ATP-dependent Clp protease proteolytic subunit [Oscillospiraceae bacterium]
MPQEVAINLDDLLKNIPSPADYQYYKGLKNNRIIFNDEVGMDIIESVVIPLLDMDNDPLVEHIELIINSNGGDVYSGMTLCSVIDRLKTKTTITILSVAASMGALMAMAGHNNPNVTTVCYPFTVFLIHSGSYYFEGSANAVRDSFAFQEDYEKMITDYILTHTSIPREVYEKKTRFEWYLTATQAKSYDIIDEIL